jgi:hypothetical protein
MSRSFEFDDLAALGETFAEDLRSAFPEVELPERVVQDHVAAMISAAQLLAEEGASVLEPASHPSPEGLTTSRRRSMRARLIRRVVAVAAGLLLSLGGLAVAGAFEGSDDPGDGHPTAVVTDQTEGDHAENADDQGEDVDDQGEDADDQGENESADDQGEDADEQGEDADDQGEDESAGDDQGDHEDSHEGESDDGQSDEGDSQD